MDGLEGDGVRTYGVGGEDEDLGVDVVVGEEEEVGLGVVDGEEEVVGPRDGVAGKDIGGRRGGERAMWEGVAEGRGEEGKGISGGGPSKEGCTGNEGMMVPCVVAEKKFSLIKYYMS